MENSVQSFYGNKLRVRTCGLCTREDSILLVNHRGISDGDFWMPPGGGIQFGESAPNALRREFLEETGLIIEVQDFLFVGEFIKSPLHAVELFFKVNALHGEVKTGQDPEAGSPKIIVEAKFVSWQQIAAMPSHELHGIFKHAHPPSAITDLKGFFKV